MFAIKKRAICALMTCAAALFGLNSAQAGIPIQHWQQAGVPVYDNTARAAVAFCALRGDSQIG